MHRVFIDTPLPTSPASIQVDGDDAAHTLLVKRMDVGDRLEVLDGLGGIALGTITHATKAKRHAHMALDLTNIRRLPPAQPIIHVCSAVPKGDRAAQLIDQLAQVGAASWRALDTDHGVAEAGNHKLDRFARIAREASKQCGRAWLLRIDDPVTLDVAIVAPPGTRVLVADATGQPPRAAAPQVITRLLIGPEGGWSAREREVFARAGTPSIAAGPHVMRIETAAVAAAVALMLA
jgi:16S rRNA (uracil1498-N3)-methyltransferase